MLQSDGGPVGGNGGSLNAETSTEIECPCLPKPSISTCQNTPNSLFLSRSEFYTNARILNREFPIVALSLQSFHVLFLVTAGIAAAVAHFSPSFLPSLSANNGRWDRFASRRRLSAILSLPPNDWRF